MYLHLGEDVVIPQREIIAVINLIKSDKDLNTRDDMNLHIARDEDNVVQLSDKPRSCVITDQKVYLSPISTATLKKRAGKMDLE